MQQSLQLLDQLTKSKSLEEVPDVIKIAFNSILKALKNANNKIDQQRDTLQTVKLRIQQAQSKIEQRVSYKEIEQMMKVVTRYEEQIINNAQSFTDTKLSSRNSIHQNGLDRIMIQEVKTIADALIETKLQIHRASLTECKCLQSSIQRKLDQNEMKNLRLEVNKLTNQIRVLQQQKIGDYQLEERLLQQRRQINQQMEKISTKTKREFRSDRKENDKILKVEEDLQNIRHSLRNKNQNSYNMPQDAIKMILDKKADVSDLFQLKEKLNRELVNKISVNETESIVKNFQSEIFAKLNELNNERRKFQQNVHKLIRLQLMSIEQIPRQIRNSLNKVQKTISNRVRLEERQPTKQDLQRIAQNQLELKTEIKKMETQTNKQIKSLFEIINASFDDQEQGKSKISRFTLRRNTARHGDVELARWSSNPDSELKNGLVSWQREDFNSNQQNFLWEKRKTQIVIVSAGIYQIKLCVFSAKRPNISVMINGEQSIKLREQKIEEGLRVKQSYGTSLFDFILVPGRAKVCIKIEQQLNVQAILCLKRY